MRRRALSLGLLVLISGCRVFDESLLGHEVDAGAVDAGAPRDASRGTDAPVAIDAGPDCPLKRPPPRPAGGDDGTDVGELVYVLHHFTWDQEGDRWRTIGWDLDGLCSLPPTPSVECSPPAASAPLEIDGEGGIDNSLGHNVLGLLLIAFPELAGRLDAQEWGHGSLLVRVRRWNGLDDDPRVDVTFTQTIAGTPPLPDGGPPEVRSEDLRNGIFPPYPLWDGNDWFWARNSSFVGGDVEQPRIRSDNAYVANRVLVVELPDRIPFSFSSDRRSISVLLSDAVLAGRISDDLSTLEDPQMAARWPVPDLLAALPYAGVCVGTESFDATRRITDLTADVRAMPGTGGAGLTCDALSVGLGFIGTRGRLAGLIDSHDTLANNCELEMMDAGVPDAGVPDAG